MQGAALLFQGRQVAGWLIVLAVLPAGVIDSGQLEGQGTGLVVFAIVLLFLLVVIALGPRLLFHRTGRVFMEGLAAEFRAAVAEVDGFGGAALDDDRGHAIELRHLGSTFKAVPVGAKGDE